MPLAVEKNELSDPVSVAFLSAVAQMPTAADFGDAIEKTGRAGEGGTMITP
jgi:hypothetical protein